MHVLLTYVSSLNGKIVKKDSKVRKWTSKENQEYFKKIEAEAEVIIRSSVTYAEVKKKIASDKNKNHIVMTRSPEKYANEVSSNIEFTNENPNKLIARLEKKGVEKVLLSVGSQVVKLFLRENLIDEFQLTLEPVIFGEGVGMVAEGKIEENFQLKSIEKLNKQGTILLRYEVIR